MRNAYDFPAGDGDWFVEFEPGCEQLLSLQAGYAEGVDGLKVFATAGAANFGRLQFPALDRPVDRHRARTAPVGQHPASALQALIDAVTGASRTSRPAGNPAADWTSRLVEVRVRRG